MTGLAAWAGQWLWGSGTLALLMGTGVFLTVRLRFLPWRNLGYALSSALGRKARRRAAPGEVSPFSALMTALGATVGTGNIVGVATALTAGGPGALVWMELAALVGMSTTFTECLLSVRWRQRGRDGAFTGGPMYVMRRGLGGRPGRILGAAFALFAVGVSLGMGSAAQASAMTQAAGAAFGIPTWICALAAAALVLPAVLGGRRSVAAVSTLVVPAMLGVYLAASAAVILGNLAHLPESLGLILRCAFSPRAAAGGAAGCAVTALDALRYGVSRGVFSNEAGLGSAGICAASAASDSPVRQAYIGMTGVFFDTTVVCTATALAICCSGVLGQADGAALTILAFQTVLGPLGGALVAFSVLLFAFSSILGWAYQGEQAFAYLTGGRWLLPYRCVFVLSVFCGGAGAPEAVLIWSDLCNALMCLPNLTSLLLLSGTAAREARRCQSVIRSEGNR